MAICSFEKYFGEYIDGQLAKDADLEFLQHLESCSACPERLDLFYATHHRLKKIKRPAAGSVFLEKYANNINRSFRPPSYLKRMSYSLEEFFNLLLPSPSLWWRFAAIIVVLISGIYIGRFLLKPVETETTVISDMPYLWEKPVSTADIEYINYYLLVSEMILLELENINPANPEVLISNETAQKLLIKTFLVHESAIQLNAPPLLRFLSKMELILYELANMEKYGNEASIESIQMVLRTSNLLEEVHQLQKIIADTRKG